ncbi:MAG: glycosyltransferase [Phycisphaerales bacterium]|nr:glycosyltransferase [Phycisphaerales bacterium]
MTTTPRVLMLGWEFPPFITGGLGTACHGLTRGLTKAGCDVTFALPRSIDRSHSSHVRLLSPATEVAEPAAWTAPPAGDVLESVPLAELPASEAKSRVESRRMELLRQGTPERIRILDLPAMAASSYCSGTAHGRIVDVVAGTDPVLAEYIDSLTDAEFQQFFTSLQEQPLGERSAVDIAIRRALPEAISRGSTNEHAATAPTGGYDGDLILEAERYAHFCVRAAQKLPFDIIHAHDWLTYPAGIALARLTGRPLVVHVHATEFDRSGDHVNQAVYNIERRGMHAAVRVLAVSMLTRNLLVNRYGISPAKIDVVYNGVDLEPSAYGIKRIERSERIVLYFGRITMQKGPEYFVRAAKRVLEVEDNVRFVVAGSGDQATQMIEMAAELGIGGRMTFTGFLRGKDIQRVFSLADLYVMPSVSEPFGIAPLEAMGHRVPVIISRNSGVSEVLTHALKVNFWDVDEIANKIVAVLRHPPLRAELRDRGLFEVRGITWDGAAKRCLDSYRKALSVLHTDSLHRAVAAH